jgi:hypothetical protein
MNKLKTWSITSLLGGLLTLVGPGRVLASPCGAGAVRQRCETLSRALTTHDLRTIKATLGTKIRMDSGKVVTREEYMLGIARMFRQFDTAPGGTQLARRVYDVAVRGDRAAVSVAQTITVRDPAGAQHQLSGRLLQTWRKLGATWFLVQEHEDVKARSAS